MGKNVSFWAWMKEARFFILQFLFERIDKETKKLYLYIKNFYPFIFVLISATILYNLSDNLYNLYVNGLKLI